MKREKLISLENLPEQVKRLRAERKKIVATNGCFDLLHVGHVRYLNAARALGDVLIVGINGDASVRALKGNARPINKAEDRAEVLAALECVDVVVIFPEMRATKFLELAAPDVYVKGGDYQKETLNSEERAVLSEIGAKIDIVPWEKGYSTSQLLARLEKK
ncbi:MAG TPA: D-glycero-beta-D-manno-heptose 1-phosphate adenylyltransferase [Chthoniobacterales bacterium]|jgi:rfaE bifunctional protein nucleotidyltransferase chain/domain|nr:D-glycero-beta-D-manno-heptose 1-phosphate adenylyltransferase [Chthoniobacterales bacterium]